MTEASGGAGPGARPVRRWDVALSFAGAQRDYVGQVARALKERGVSCFYDADELVRLWGTHLAEELPKIYTQESATVVIFVSADYAAGDWTQLERRATFSRAVTEAGVFVLPARFDDSELPGLLSDVVYVDLRHYEPEQFADLLAARLAAPPTDGGDPARAAGSTHPAGEMRAAGADPRQDELLKRLAEEIQAARNERQRDARTQRPAQAKHVDVSKYVGRVPRSDDQGGVRFPPGGFIRRDDPGGWGDGDFLTISVTNNSDAPVYDLDISWRQGGLLSKEPWGEPDRVGILRPGRQVQRSRELPGRAWDPLAEMRRRRYSAVVNFRDANGIRWQVMPDSPPIEVPSGREE